MTYNLDDALSLLRAEAIDAGMPEDVADIVMAHCGCIPTIKRFLAGEIVFARLDLDQLQRGFEGRAQWLIQGNDKYDWGQPTGFSTDKSLYHVHAAYLNRSSSIVREYWEATT